VERGALAAATVLAATVAGVGWLYLLFRTAGLDAGPRLSGALPLQQLAGSDAQPLARLAVAWLPAGLAAGGALAALTRLGPVARAVAVAAVAGTLLFVAGAVSDAIALNEGVGAHLGGQFGRAGTWVPVALMVTGALPAGRAGMGRGRAATGR
jgi:hypothetical protein